MNRVEQGLIGLFLRRGRGEIGWVWAQQLIAVTLALGAVAAGAMLGVEGGGVGEGVACANACPVKTLPTNSTNIMPKKRDDRNTLNELILIANYLKLSRTAR